LLAQPPQRRLAVLDENGAITLVLENPLRRENSALVVDAGWSQLA
jgi:hypothetical protein